MSPACRHCRHTAAARKLARRRRLLLARQQVRAGGGATKILLAVATLLVVSDILPNKTTALAHYLLPGCAHAEKRGSFVNVKGRVQRFMQNIQPKGNARPEWEVLHDLAQGVTGQNGFVSIEGLFNQMAGEVPAFKGMTWAGLGDLGATAPI